MAKAIFKKSVPVLLAQGFDFSVGPGLTLPFEFQLKTDRGYIEGVDVIATFNGPYDEVLFTDARFTLQAGGQELLTDEPFDRYSYLWNLGYKRLSRVDVILNDAQTMAFTMFNPGTAPIALSAGSVMAFYATPEHSAFVKQWHLNNGLGQKRQTFVLNVPALTAAPDTLFLEGRIPRNKGNVIGVSVLCNIAANIQGRRINVFIDGIQIFENITASYFSKLNQKEPWLFPINLRPGATFRIEAVLIAGFVAGAFEENYYLGFVFDN